MIAAGFDNIPRELADQPHWLLWAFESRQNGKGELRLTKVPYYCADPHRMTFRYASSIDPKTWTDFSKIATQALAAKELLPGFGGVGFSLTDSGIAGIDFDACRDPETGGIEDWARQEIEALDSYTEVSPSGTGLKVFVKAKLPGAGKKAELGPVNGHGKVPAIELYDTGRYFAVTGDHWPGSPREIRDCDLSKLYAKVASYAQPQAASATETRGFSLEDFFRRHHVHSLGSKPAAGGTLYWVPCVGSHPGYDTSDGKAWVMQDSSGKLSAGCWHSSCSMQNNSRGWESFRSHYEPEHGKKERENSAPLALGDDDLALRLTERSPDLRYVSKWGRWMRFAPPWREDAVLDIFDRAREVCREALAECGEKQNGTAKWLKAAATRAAIENMARSDKRHAATVEQWDADIYALGTGFELCNLRDGTTRPQAQEDYITKSTSVTPAANADCPLWQAFLKRITDGNVSLENYLQRVTGYCLTGDTREHALFFLYGLGANGKSTFTNTLLWIFGGYGQVASIETFIETKHERHPQDLAAMRGARLVTVGEPKAGQAWDESKIKTLTGGDPIRAHFMRSDEFEYLPQFKLMIHGNKKPSLRSTDEAMRRRLHLVPFVVTIPEDQRDETLKSKLQAEGPGILRWALDGCRMWQEHGLNPPAVVREATAEYLLSEDAISSWVEERALVSPQAGSTKSSVLYQDFKQWAEQRGEHCGSEKRFSQELADRGFRKYRSNGTRFECIGLKDHDDA